MNSKSSITNFWNRIRTLIKEMLSQYQADHSFKSVVWGKNSDGTYQISYLGQKYNVPNAMGTELELGQSVWVKIPNGILRHMHIYGIAPKK